MEKVLTKGELREWNRIKWKILNMGPKQWAAGVTKSEIMVDMPFRREEGPSGDGLGDPDTMGDDSHQQNNHQDDEEAENISDNESGTELSGREIMRMVKNQTSSQVLEKNWVMSQFKINRDDVEAVIQDCPEEWKVDVPYAEFSESL